MARDLTGGMITALTAQVVEPVMLLELLFDSGPLRFWNGVGEITYDSNVYQGAGQFLTITEVVETELLKASGVTFQLSGIGSTVLTLALAENYQERIANLYFGAFDASKNLISNTFTLFTGRMDIMTIEANVESLTVALSVENRLVDLERPKERRYTPEDQKEAFAGDLGLDFVTQLNNGKVVVWGLSG